MKLIIMKNKLKMWTIFAIMSLLLFNQTLTASAGSASNITSSNPGNFAISNGAISWSSSSVSFYGLSAARISGGLGIISYIGFYAFATRTNGGMCDNYVSVFGDGYLRNDQGYQKFIGGSSGSIGGHSIQVDDLGYAPFGITIVLFINYASVALYLHYIAFVLMDPASNYALLLEADIQMSCL